ncbi:DUF3221 domain-containing protein, partial [Bacillus thuringiensis]|uniref:DUF3221 domain-containing protein n=1 Tax=Bacillus thuringiensis TaxID=1428 RepID=UPI0037D76DD1
MFTVKQKLVTVAGTLTLRCGFTFGITPASAASHETTTNLIYITTFEKQQQTHFTGYVFSFDSNYMTIVDAPTMEEAQMYQENWWDFVNKNKILLVPILDNNSYILG